MTLKKAHSQFPIAIIQMVTSRKAAWTMCYAAPEKVLLRITVLGVTVVNVDHQCGCLLRHVDNNARAGATAGHAIVDHERDESVEMVGGKESPLWRICHNTT